MKVTLYRKTARVYEALGRLGEARHLLLQESRIRQMEGWTDSTQSERMRLGEGEAVPVLDAEGE